MSAMKLRVRRKILTEQQLCHVHIHKKSELQEEEGVGKAWGRRAGWRGRLEQIVADAF